MTLILNDAQVSELLTMKDCIAAMEEAYGELAAGRGIYRIRTDMIAPADGDDNIFALKSMDAVIPKFGVGSIRVNSDTLHYQRDGNRLRRDRVPTDEDGRYTGFVLLFSTETGELLMIYPDGIQSKRVAAISGLGIRHLARPNSRDIALIGSGVQARAQVEAALAVMQVDTIRCFSTNQERRESFCAAMRDKHSVDIRPVALPEEAVEGADVVLCGTNSRSHVFFRDWIEPGMHISCVNMFELEPSVVTAADVVSTHIRDCDPIFIKTDGIGVLPEEPGAGYQDLAAETDFTTLPTIAEVISGDAPRRASDDQVSCMVNSVGCGYQFAVVGYLLNKKAREAGLGNEVPTDWFTALPEA
jgi:ornithine cyclodeaminase/alanine dehydrogenase-like protein (mu-crystallin family)